MGLFRSDDVMGVGSGPRPAIAARLEAATGRAPSPREVEILFDIFDASHNDKISLREARSALHRGDAHPLII